MKILFFIESLRSGGKERRLVELLIYLKKNTNYELRLVITENEIHYNYVRDLDIPIDIIKRKHLKKDPSLFFRFYRIAKQFNPDIIHTWGTMPTFYAIPTKLLIRKPLLANLISNAKKDYSNLSLSAFFNVCDYKFADVILGNSMAGFKAYGLQNNPKMHLIYNGVHFERFKIIANKDKLKKQLNISTPYIAIMVASASKNKDYDLFLDVAKQMANIRNDITFIGIGGGRELNRLKSRIENENIKNIILTGKRNDVEQIVSEADICLLLTNNKNHAEGISNSIIEYMALGKPVITTDLVGGSREIVEEGRSGYIMNPDATEIAKKIDELINNPHLREKLGARGKEIIQQKFSIKQMGEKYIELYKNDNSKQALMIHILVDWADGSSFFLKKEFEKINIATIIYDIPNYNIKDRTKKWRLPILYIKYITLANKALKKSKSGDFIICWNFTTSIALGYLCKLFNEERTILALNIIAHKKIGIGEFIRKLIFTPVMENPNFFITVNSNYYITEYSNRFRIASQKFFELNDPIQNDKIEPFEYRTSYVFVGGEAQRDWDTLFEAAELLPEIKFFCIARKKYYSTNSKPPANVEIQFDTPKNFFYQKMNDSGLVVIPLKSELPAGLIILLKAAIMNKPIIATQTPSVNNYIVDAQNGFLVKKGDALSLADSIKRLFFNEKLQKKFTANLLNNIQYNFSQEIYTKRLSQIIEKIEINKKNENPPHN